MTREKALFRIRLKMLQEEMKQSAAQSERRDGGTRFGKRNKHDSESPQEMQGQIMLDDKPMPLPDDIGQLISSIVLDLGIFPMSIWNLQVQVSTTLH